MAYSCQSCDINIGLGFIETIGYRIGGYLICGYCKKRLDKFSHVRIGSHKEGYLLLYSDGSTKRARLGTKHGNEIMVILPD